MWRNAALDSADRYFSLDVHRGNRKTQLAAQCDSSWQAHVHTFAAAISLLGTKT